MAETKPERTLTRVGFTLVVAGSALAIGGAPPVTVVGLCLAVLVLLPIALRREADASETLELPLGLGALVFMAAWTGLTAVWMPPALVEGLAPELARVQASALGSPATRVSVLPGASALELARLLGLAGLFLIASTFNWRTSATAVMLTGTLVALVGVGHELSGATRILGVYAPLDLEPSRAPAFVTTFVNPNHQSSLFALGALTSLALGLDRVQRARRARSVESARARRDRALVAFACLAIQLVALVLSLSRGALLAFGLVAPVAMFLVLRSLARGDRDERARSGPHSQPRALGLWALGLGLGLVLVFVAERSGAREQLVDMWFERELVEKKFGAALDSLDLITWSPWIGVGRGATVDLLPAVQRDLDYRFTHVESTPLVFLVEWGPIVGGLALLATARFCWLLWRHQHSTPRRVAALGLLAVTIHGCGDFGWELLGVAAPTVALAGALAPPSGRSLPRARLRGLGLGLGLTATVIAGARYSRTASGLRDLAERVEAGELSHEAALRRRPLDPRVHERLARVALDELLATMDEGAPAGATTAETGASVRGQASPLPEPSPRTEASQRSETPPRTDTSPGAGVRLRGQALARARLHAELATRFGPASMNAELLLAAIAELEGGDANPHLRRGLARARAQISVELARWLIARRSPSALAELAPSSDPTWTFVALGLFAADVDYGDAFAAWFDDGALAGSASLLRARAARARDRAGLALHHARLGSQAAPGRSALVLEQLAALRALGREDAEREIAAILDAALSESLDDPAIIEEAFIINALRLGDEARLDRAVALVEELVARSGSAEVRERRRELARQLQLARR